MYCLNLGVKGLKCGRMLFLFTETSLTSGFVVERGVAHELLYAYFPATVQEEAQVLRGQTLQSGTGDHIEYAAAQSLSGEQTSSGEIRQYTK